MKQYFADTFFFVAYLSPRDHFHKQARDKHFEQAGFRALFRVEV